MKRKNILFSLMIAICLGLTSGCGENPTYEIKASSNEEEFGTITGGGRYEMGATVTLKMYPNPGCTFSKLELDGTNVNVTGNSIENINTNPTYQFQVTEASIGSYVANFDCTSNNTLDGSTQTYIVRYVLKASTNRSVLNLERDDTNPFGLGDFDTTGSFEKVISGRTIGRNITYVDKYSNYTFEWYTDADCTPSKKIDVSTYKIAKDQTLYGKAIEKNVKTELQNAVDAFGKNTDGIVVKNGNITANVKNLGDSTKFKMEVKDAGNKYSYKVDGNNYYQYDDNTSILKYSLKNTGFEISSVEDVYKYIRVKDLKVATFEENPIKDGSKFTYEVTSENNEKYKLTIENGILIEFEFDNAKYEIKYETISAINIPNNAKDKHFIKIITDIKELETEAKASNTFENIITVVPVNNESIETKLKKFTSKEAVHAKLKNYAYTWTTVNGGNCTSNSFDFNSQLQENIVSVCLHESANLKDLKTTIENTENFDLSVIVNVFGEPMQRTYNSNADIVNFNDSTSTADGITKSLLNSLKQLYTGDLEYDKFEKDGNNTYKIYSKDVLIPILTIELENGKIKSVKFYSDGVLYTYSFGYSTTPSQE